MGAESWQVRSERWAGGWGCPQHPAPSPCPFPAAQESHFLVTPLPVPEGAQPGESCQLRGREAGRALRECLPAPALARPPPRDALLTWMTTLMVAVPTTGVHTRPPG